VSPSRLHLLVSHWLAQVQGGTITLLDHLKGTSDAQGAALDDDVAVSRNASQALSLTLPRQFALHRRHGMVDKTLHEHAPALSEPSQPTRSRSCLSKCAKDSGRFPRAAIVSAVEREDFSSSASDVPCTTREREPFSVPRARTLSLARSCCVLARRHLPAFMAC
jgi:hypothetical protein